MRSRSAGGSAMRIPIPPLATERLSLRPLAPLYGRTERPQRIAASRGPRSDPGGPPYVCSSERLVAPLAEAILAT